ncbi:MAG: GNAT family N-acetyltransferase [Spirochaetes bacterium]|nr:GNAT family N-acetyltransferase [Spirochaetota bacterium]
MFRKPEKIKLENEFVKLTPMTPDDAVTLFEAASENGDFIFHHMFFGPFNNVPEVKSYIEIQTSNADNIVFTVFSKRLGKTVGSCSIINIDSISGNAEIGSVWYSDEARNTEINSATSLLLLTYLFEVLHYRRIAWKCDNDNTSSKHAAESLGFEYEGTFKKHLIIKGRNRDTVWFSIIDDSWPQKKILIEKRINKKITGSKR